MNAASMRQIVHIVDDDNAVRDSLSLLLGLRGYATRTFSTGDEFLAASTRPPRAASCSTCECQARGARTSSPTLAARSIRMPIIVLTAHGDAASARAALKGGAFEFLEKPVDDALLGKTIEAALAQDAQARAMAGAARCCAAARAPDAAGTRGPRSRRPRPAQPRDRPRVRHQPAHRRGAQGADHGQVPGRADAGADPHRDRPRAGHPTPAPESAAGPGSRRPRPAARINAPGPPGSARGAARASPPSPVPCWRSPLIPRVPM